MAVLCGFPVLADSVTLVGDGVAKCRVFVATEASATECFGAEELARYLGKVTGAGVPVTTGAVVRAAGEYPVAVSVVGSAHAPRETFPNLKEEGFALDVREDGMDIVGGNPLGALYGCYHVLKQWADVRWLVPGKDGEYVTPKKTVAVPMGRLEKNPYLVIREARCRDALWCARNTMHDKVAGACFHDTNDVITAEGRKLERVGMRGYAATGHLMSTLLCAGEPMDKVWAEHPEFFPLIDGERRKITAKYFPNPCVSNPALLDRMAKWLVARFRRPHGNDTYSLVNNNDTTVWCQCDRCRALDPPERKGSRGELSDRYWWFMNELGRRVWAEVPDAKLAGGPYQNFWFAPLKVKIDPRLYCVISYNNQCWRHSVLDPACPVNKVMREVFAGFKTSGVRFVVNRDEIGAYDGYGSPGCEMQPVARTLAKNFAEYPELGCQGSHLCVMGTEPEFEKWAAHIPPYFGKKYHWYAMWQACYVASLLMYDPTVDWQAELERANRLFYGPAWEGGMKEFRALLTKCFYETPGCMGWGQGAPMGRCLDAPGSEEKLKALLEQAIAVAKACGDARVIRNVAREKEIFELTWLVQRKRYLENFSELSVFRRTGPITVDGVLDEADWKTADQVTDFRLDPGSGMNVKTPAAKVQTFVSATYDHDTLYLGITALEPNPGKILSPMDAPDAFHRLGDRLEVFYCYPDMADACYHLAINSKGECIAARQNSATDRTEFKTTAKIATKVGTDRWTLELAIPCTEIGQACFDGGTWKLNVGRDRKVEGEKRECSSCCKGHFHGPSNFLNIRFSPSRTKEGNVVSWRNSSFDKHVKMDPREKKRWKNYVGEDDQRPDGWNVMDVVGEYHRKAGGEDWYLSLRNPDGKVESSVRQYFFFDGAAKLKATFKARGKGSVTLLTLTYALTPDKKNYTAVDGTGQYQTFKVTEDWQTFTGFAEKKTALPADRVMFRFLCDKGSQIDLDDVLVTPCE